MLLQRQEISTASKLQPNSVSLPYHTEVVDPEIVSFLSKCIYLSLPDPCPGIEYLAQTPAQQMACFRRAQPALHLIGVLLAAGKRRCPPLIEQWPDTASSSESKGMVVQGPRAQQPLCSNQCSNRGQQGFCPAIVN
jgi:hypothetical protein